MTDTTIGVDLAKPVGNPQELQQGPEGTHSRTPAQTFGHCLSESQIWRECCQHALGA